MTYLNKHEIYCENSVRSKGVRRRGEFRGLCYEEGGDGSDPWMGRTPLCERFGHLFDLAEIAVGG
jgi:hypothetical protein